MSNKIEDLIELGKATRFSSTNQPKKNGRRPSLKNELAKLADVEFDGWFPVPMKDVKIKDDHVLIRCSNQEAMALKIIQIATGKSSRAFDALKLYLETFDGKATQPIEGEIEVNGYSILEK